MKEQVLSVTGARLLSMEDPSVRPSVGDYAYESLQTQDGYELFVVASYAENTTPMAQRTLHPNFYLPTYELDWDGSIITNLYQYEYNAIEQLEDLIEQGATIHFAGGEPDVDWESLADRVGVEQETFPEDEPSVTDDTENIVL